MKYTDIDRRLIFLFGGQGSQYPRMLESFYRNDYVFRETLERLSAKFSPYIGKDVIRILYSEDDSDKSFWQLKCTHPCIFMTEYATAKMLISKGRMPDIVVGTSLGEITAAAIANVIDEDDAVKIAAAQAISIEECCKEGGMLTVLQNSSIFEDKALFADTEIASLNFSGHFVVSGTDDALRKTENALKEKDILCVRVPVTRAFHSSYIDEAKSRFLEMISDVRINKPSVRILSCVTGCDIVPESCEYFWETVRKPVLFERTIEKFGNSRETIWIDAGAGGTLASFTKNVLSKEDSKNVYFVESLFGKSHVEEFFERIKMC